MSKTPFPIDLTSLTSFGATKNSGGTMGAPSFVSAPEELFFGGGDSGKDKDEVVKGAPDQFDFGTMMAGADVGLAVESGNVGGGFEFSGYVDGANLTHNLVLLLLRERLIQDILEREEVDEAVRNMLEESGQLGEFLTDQRKEIEERVDLMIDKEFVVTPVGRDQETMDGLRDVVLRFIDPENGSDRLCVIASSFNEYALEKGWKYERDDEGEIVYLDEEKTQPKTIETEFLRGVGDSHWNVFHLRKENRDGRVVVDAVMVDSISGESRIADIFVDVFNSIGGLQVENLATSFSRADGQEDEHPLNEIGQRIIAQISRGVDFCDRRQVKFLHPILQTNGVDCGFFAIFNAIFVSQISKNQLMRLPDGNLGWLKRDCFSGGIFEQYLDKDGVLDSEELDDGMDSMEGLNLYSELQEFIRHSKEYLLGRGGNVVVREEDKVHEESKLRTVGAMSDDDDLPDLEETVSSYFIRLVKSFDEVEKLMINIEQGISVDFGQLSLLKNELPGKICEILDEFRNSLLELSEDGRITEADYKLANAIVNQAKSSHILFRRDDGEFIHFEYKANIFQLKEFLETDFLSLSGRQRKTFYELYLNRISSETEVTNEEIRFLDFITANFEDYDLMFQCVHNMAQDENIFELFLQIFGDSAEDEYPILSKVKDQDERNAIYVQLISALGEDWFRDYR